MTLKDILGTLIGATHVKLVDSNGDNRMVRFPFTADDTLLSANVTNIEPNGATCIDIHIDRGLYSEERCSNILRCQSGLYLLTGGISVLKGGGRHED